MTIDQYLLISFWFCEFVFPFDNNNMLFAVYEKK